MNIIGALAVKAEPLLLFLKQVVIINDISSSKLQLNIEDFNLSSRVKDFLQKYRQEIWLVGGAARDKILGREPEDYDFLITGRQEQEIRELLSPASKVGKIFPVYLWRKVEFSWTPEQTPHRDLAGRDLTINSLAVNLADGRIIDPHGGLQDLHRGLIQFLPGALDSDPHRFYRALRFLARLPSFYLTEESWKKLVELPENNLEQIEAERVAEEFKKILTARAGERFFFALAALEKPGSYFSWFPVDEIMPSVKRWRSAYFLTDSKKLLFISLILSFIDADKLDRLHRKLPLAKKWFRAAAIAARAIPHIKNWKSVDCEKLVETYNNLELGVLTPAESVLIARACEISNFNFPKIFGRNYYQGLQEMWEHMRQEIRGEDLLRIMDAGPELGEELFQRRSQWLEENRRYFK